MPPQKILIARPNIDHVPEFVVSHPTSAASCLDSYFTQGPANRLGHRLVESPARTFRQPRAVSVSESSHDTWSLFLVAKADMKTSVAAKLTCQFLGRTEDQRLNKGYAALAEGALSRQQ